jgi:hypothetical protein
VRWAHLWFVLLDGAQRATVRGKRDQPTHAARVRLFLFDMPPDADDEQLALCLIDRQLQGWMASSDGNRIFFLGVQRRRCEDGHDG